LKGVRGRGWFRGEERWVEGFVRVLGCGEVIWSEKAFWGCLE